MNRFRWFGVVSKAGLVSWALITGIAVNSAWAGGHELLSERTAEQQELAGRFQTFIDRMERKYFARMEKLNGETT